MPNLSRIMRKVARSRITSIVLVLIVTMSMVSFFSWRGGPGSSNANPLLPDFVSNDISKIVLTKANQEKQTVEKNDNKWVVSSDNNLPAESEKINNILKLLQEAEIREVVSYNPVEKDKYGLGATSTRLELYSGSEKINDIWLGSQNDSFSTSYVRIEGEKSVMITSTNFSYLLTQGDLLDRKAFTMKFNDLNEVVWQSKAQQVKMVRENENWVINGKKISAQALGELFKKLDLVEASDVSWLSDASIINYDWQLEFKSANSSQKISLRRLNQDKAVLVREGDKRLFTIPGNTFELFLFPTKLFGLIK